MFSKLKSIRLLVISWFQNNRIDKAKLLNKKRFIEFEAWKRKTRSVQGSQVASWDIFIHADCMVSTFPIWYPVKIWYPLRTDLVSNYRFGILGTQQLFNEKIINVLDPRKCLFFVFRKFCRFAQLMVLTVHTNHA